MAGRKDLRQALQKFLQFFDKALHLNPRVLRFSVCHDGEVGELTTRLASYELTLVAFVRVLEYAKRARIIHIHRAYGARVAARTKNIRPYYRYCYLP